MIVTIAKLIVVTINICLWALIAPIWFAHLLRTILHYSFANIKNLYAGAAPLDPVIIERQAGMWSRGLIDILATLTSSKRPPRLTMPEPSMKLLWDSIFAIIFYATMYMSYTGLLTSTAKSLWASAASSLPATLVGSPQPPQTPIVPKKHVAETPPPSLEDPSPPKAAKKKDLDWGVDFKNKRKQEKKTDDTNWVDWDIGPKSKRTQKGSPKSSDSIPRRW